MCPQSWGIGIGNNISSLDTAILTKRWKRNQLSVWRRRGNNQEGYARKIAKPETLWDNDGRVFNANPFDQRSEGSVYQGWTGWQTLIGLFSFSFTSQSKIHQAQITSSFWCKAHLCSSPASPWVFAVGHSKSNSSSSPPYPSLPVSELFFGNVKEMETCSHSTKSLIHAPSLPHFQAT